ncbi:MAG: nucleoside-diphosphate sugar epimerase/dehydratase [Coriobacteriia bacterium]|nr:nucleoside-diphosphate sugar epimerase/dehydratase [Coriobacteriia bacterium]
MEPDLVAEPNGDEGGFWIRLKRLFYESHPVQIVSMMLADAVIVIMALFLAYFARFEGEVPPEFLQYSVPAMFVTIVVFILAMWFARLYHIVLRYVGIQVMGRLTAAVTVALVALTIADVALSQFTDGRPVPLGVILATGAFAFVGLAALRSVGRLWVVMTGAGRRGDHRVLIIGAGDAGSLLLRDIETQPQLGYNVIGFLDDHRAKIGLKVRSAEVLGPIADLQEIVECEGVDEILVAIPSMGSDRRRQILEFCTAAGVPTRMISGIAADAVSTGLADLRPVEIEDLLGREPNEIDVERISETLTGKVVAVTGAAGSIGSELCRQIMLMRPAKLVLAEIDESRLYELYLELEDMQPGIAVMRICDIRDDRKLMRVFGAERPQVVFHAAAYKHVPLMEDEPEEAIRANVLGTMNVLRACEAVNAERFVFISTDKAVEPRNVMGATKALAELVMLSAARYGIGAIAVRFGNVLGSRGSVIPIFEDQLRRGGPIRVTHPEVTRYFMTIPEAARLVLQAQAMSEGGDIFVLDMGQPVRIVDLAQRMIVLSGVPTHIEFTGLRPGEKLHEILVHEGEDLIPTECPAVTRLNALPRIAPDFGDQIADLLMQARLGDNPGIKQLLAELSGACFGQLADAGECSESELEWE